MAEIATNLPFPEWAVLPPATLNSGVKGLAATAK